MSIVLSVYSQVAFKEYLLPPLNNADHIITFHSNYFQLEKDVSLQLEVLDYCWKIKNSVDYKIVTAENARISHELKNNEILQLRTRNHEDISIIVKNIASGVHAFQKYKLQDINEITIGKNSDNDIAYDYLGMVSRNHARIVKTPAGYKIHNDSPNGVYVNSLRVEKEAELQFGSFINIIGLHIVFLRDVIAIDTEFKDVRISEEKLKRYETYDEKTVLLNAVAETSKGKTVYHRAPRNYEKLNSDVIDIEEPPQLARTKKQSILMTIGPSFTMVLPMLLGSILMIYASGRRSSFYMYSGLVMSVSSALVAVIWSLLNSRNQRKEEKGEEEYRFEVYSEYLVEKTNEIKEKYERTEKKLNTTYPAAMECLKYDIHKGVLWNRNRTHEDFLSHRLGVGDTPFQIKIEVPKKRFKLYKDSLSEKPAFIKDNYSMLYNVPVMLDLIKESMVGIIGGKNKEGAIEVAKLLSAQLAANNCYTDLKLVYIYDGSNSSDFSRWGFAKWLPHVWSEDKKTRFVASGKEEASDVFYELTKIFRTRMERSEGASKEEIPKPYYVVFVSDISVLTGEPFSKYVFDHSKECGLTTFLLVERYEELPNDCEFIIENTERFHGMYEVSESEEEKQKITFDTLEDKELERFSRYLSSLQVLEIEEGGEIPNSITFFEMLGINRLEDIPVRELWAKNRTYENIKGMIGKKAGNMPCYLDVHEKYHGPHGLVAGTTGSGKSETLQTYILSLAINYSPDDIGFFIIDYKGGGMANLFKGLPHMIGQISNLSGNQVRRAMISIKSENRRRQRVFAEHGVNNINAYTKLYKNGEAANPVPHLFIIIDEFAELKREEPEFMKELISVAQVGRSLGVHLILATQKPSGTVDDNIWSNSKFRLCLRVQDQQDSKDMLHKPDAAYITQAGRCYLQVGNDEIYELFQSGFSGAIYEESLLEESTEIAKLIDLTGKVEMTGNTARASQKKRAEAAWIDNLSNCLVQAQKSLGLEVAECVEQDIKMKELVLAFYRQLDKEGMDYTENRYNTARLKDFVSSYYETAKENGDNLNSEKIVAQALKMGRKLPKEKEKTQLDAVIEYLAKQAIHNGYNRKLQLWMPVLKTQIYLSQFDEYQKSCFKNTGWKKQSKEWEIRFVIGQMDDPENQNQMPMTIDLEEDGNIAVCGSVVCGKSTMMQTMAYALIQKYSPEDINLYAIDFSSKMMSAFEEAPHIGGIIYENDTDKIEKFFNMMSHILAERKHLFRGGNYKQYVQVHGPILPTIIVFIDNYSAFKEKTEEMYEERIIQLSREGINHGIYLIVSGAGFGMSDITTRVADNIKTVLCLSLQERHAYGELLHSVQIEVLPEKDVKGRGLAYYGKRILEYQTALAVEAENDYTRLSKIQDTCREMALAWKGKTARRIPEIPEKPVWSEFAQLDQYQQNVSDTALFPVGYDAANAEVYNIPLQDTYCYLVCGAGRTGKSNFMKICIQTALEKKAHVCVIDRPDGNFSIYSKEKKVSYVSDEEGMFHYFSELLPVFKERNMLKNQLIGEEREEDIFEFMSKERPYFIFISDMSWFVPYIYNAEQNMKGFLENVIEKGSLHNIYFFGEMELGKQSLAAGYRIYELFVKYGTGIHFGGKVSDNPMLSFEYMSYAEQARPERTGIGLLPNVLKEGETQRVVVPLARK